MKSKFRWMLCLFTSLLLQATLLASPNWSNITSRDSVPSINYLALGDSYTVGTSVKVAESYPVQLAAKIQEELNRQVDLEIIAKAGWKTNELYNVLSLGTLRQSYDLVTLCIGVNNEFRGKPFSQYKKEFPVLLKKALKLAQGDAKKVFVISIPDYAYTPFGQKNKPKSATKGIAKYNEFAKKISEKYNVQFIAITDITQDGLKDPDLVASDGLHPSGKAYQKMVERIYPEVTKVIAH